MHTYNNNVDKYKIQHVSLNKAGVDGCKEHEMQIAILFFETMHV